jgi:hypothetical protein
MAELSDVETIRVVQTPVNPIASLRCRVQGEWSNECQLKEVADLKPSPVYCQ